MTSEWIEVEIHAPVDAGELLGLLDDPSAQGAWQEGQAVRLYWRSQGWSSDRLPHLMVAVRRLLKAGDPDPRIAVRGIQDHDWNRVWAQSVTPLRIGQRIVIRPTWHPVELNPGDVEIVLDPKQAFGTGHHATTALLLEWLETCLQGGESLLDVGTGSGILAMAALRLGAGRAVGIDNDPVAIDCAREYARLNRFGSELTLDCELPDSGARFDFVLANLDRQTLLQLAEPLSASVRRTLLVSGLLKDQRAEIVEAFATVGLYPGTQREREGWLAMEFSRAQSCEEG